MLCLITDRGEELIEMCWFSTNCTFQGILEVHPGRSRVHHGLKDWSIEKTHRIDWSKLGPFMRKHAKKTDDYISETFDRVCTYPNIWQYLLY